MRPFAFRRGASVALPDPGGYDLNAVIAAARAHAGYGSILTDTSNSDAPNGLVRATLPQGTLTASTVSSISAWNSAMAGTSQRVTLQPGSYTGTLSVSGGTDCWGIIDGCTITPSNDGGIDYDTAALNIGQATRVRISGNRTTTFLKGGINLFHPSVWSTDVTIDGLDITTLYDERLGLTTARPFYGGCAISMARVHRVTFIGNKAVVANGTCFVDPGCTNIIIANCDYTVPKYADGAGIDSVHENPLRCNGVDLVAVFDSRLRTLRVGGDTTIKHFARMHGAQAESISGKRMLLNRVQGYGNPFYCDYVDSTITGEACSSHIIFDNLRFYAPSGQGGRLAIPYLNTYTSPAEYAAWNGDVMNNYFWADNVRVYTDNVTAGTSCYPASNQPPGSATDGLIAAWEAEPAWSFN